ncbi:hypothetical protein [Clostridium cibarium]|uniref:Uncharacterized protein n=1 Tax=Clostridium cibarium TaxID=2762247 RepID=A0ABR8PZ92_9CLOT|nr:hypothetical protein [Clostridium cibarium]MBD7913485.1 hypothetical protein [Clostridium cibarium]
MEYSFSIIDQNQEDFKINVHIHDKGISIFQDILLAKFDRNIGMALLDLNYIQKVIPNEGIRRDLVSKLKMFVKQSSGME